MKISVMAVNVDPVTVPELHAHIARACRSASRSLVFHVNAHGLNLAATDAGFRDLLNGADVCFCDGAGVRVAAALAGHRLPPRITYADWTWEFADFSTKEGLSWFLLGGVPGRADQAARALQTRVPGLRIAGTHHGYFDKTRDSEENRRIVAQINESGADILLVGFGMPVQERWLSENWNDLRPSVALTGGAFLDYVSGSLRRAPAIFTRTGFEWLGRLLIEPRRLGRRYVIGNPQFMFRAVKSALTSYRSRGSTR
jgi:N-acetylglucosaminyldiphosphoundecaprenol N-acetyl-beta-D-mannosaminyltransferase